MPLVSGLACQQPVAPAQWPQQVYQPLIEPRMAELLRRPDYRY